MNYKFIFITLLLIAPFASAQESLSLSVSPTLFDMTANPGQTWESNVRVINSNPYDITVYAESVNFAPQEESGSPKFVSINEEDSKGSTFAEWIALDKKEIIIPAEQTSEIPFTINVPFDAPPGGHFAAMLIGTKSPEDQIERPQLKTSQVVTSLVFLRVTGDIIEKGSIRAFRSTKKLVEKPEITFELRFENNGNVHILPQGEIRITNMWGQERGLIPVNRSTLFGNVLPDSVRKYSFTWAGEWSLADMGRYTAVASLAYGDNGRKSVVSETSFWVVPWKIATTVAIGIAIFIYLFVYAIKLYIRKMLFIAGVPTGQQGLYPTISKKTHKRISVVSPIEVGMLDLRKQWDQNLTLFEKVTSTLKSMRNYRLFMGFVALLFILATSLIWYGSSVSVTERSFDITINGAGDDIKISSEEMKYQEALQNDKGNVDEIVYKEDLPKISIVNRSGVSGLAASLGIILEKEGYEVLEIRNDLGVTDRNTVIVYPRKLLDDAIALEKKVPEALLSSFEGSTGSIAEITIYVGKDLENDVQ